MLPYSLPYNEKPHPPFWGPQNSQYNFCEEDYIVTPYVGELINTITNISYIIYGGIGIYRVRRDKLPIEHSYPFGGLIAVGICSGIFHASMKYYTQWVDDLSMLVPTSIVFHRLLTFDKSASTTWFRGMLILTVLIAFSIYHCIMDELIAHQILFGSMVWANTLIIRPLIKKKVADKVTQKTIASLLKAGTVIFLASWATWNLDFYACDTLNRWRHQLGMPWGFFLELHGWWHFGTALASFILIGTVQDMTAHARDKKVFASYTWPLSLMYGDEEDGSIKKTK